MADVDIPPMLRQRLLRDIKEIKEKPYSGIELHFEESDMTKACLILTPAGQLPLHLAIYLPTSYPLEPPRISIQSDVHHPNIFDSYICASLLDKRKDYSPAFTLRGICISLLSFFSSDKIEQDIGGEIDSKKWREREMAEDVEYGFLVGEVEYKCSKCGFGQPDVIKMENGALDISSAEPPTNPRLDGERAGMINEPTRSQAVAIGKADAADQHEGKKKEKFREFKDLPVEILLTITEFLETEEILMATQAWGKFLLLLETHNIIRNRELECFTLKQGFVDLDLGVGVHVSDRPRAIESEFDVLSREAYEQHGIRKSVQNLYFEYWLPLPLAPKHWQRVGKHVDGSLNRIARAAGVQGPPETVLFHFLNDIVVRLSQKAEDLEKPRIIRIHGMEYIDDSPRSTLTHVSEKAVESYFHLFHLLLCLAMERPAIVTNAKQLIYDFSTGIRDKQRVPNMGYLLIAILISDVEVDDNLLKNIVIETITRNVVWMLGAHPELSFMETNELSTYRLEKTFEASKTSYRLLMFLNLMQRVVRQARRKVEWKDKTEEIDGKEVKVMEVKNGKQVPVQKSIYHHMTLAELRDDLFARRGAPPTGAAAFMAGKIREIQEVNGFEGFIKHMGLQKPSQKWFTSMLRDAVGDSMRRGLSVCPLRQEEALYLRLQKDAMVQRPARMSATQPRVPPGRRYEFFPPRQGASGGAKSARGGGNRGGRGMGRGGRR